MRCMWSTTYGQAAGAAPCRRAAVHATLSGTGHIIAGLCPTHLGVLNAQRKRQGKDRIRSARIIQENPR